INIIKFIFTILQSKEITWVGGTCFSDEDGIGGYNYMSLALLFKRKINYEYIGINRITDPKNITKAKVLLSNTNSLILRDFESVKSLESILEKKRNYSIAKDLGEQYLFNLKKTLPKKNSKNILIAWRDLKNYMNDLESQELIESLCNYVYDISTNFESIYILNTDEQLDRDISERILEKLKILGLYSKLSYVPNISNTEKINVISHSKLIITSRLHIAIAGSIFGKETIVLNYSQKIENLSKRYNYTVIDENFFSLMREHV
ncbi:polysaccharide pyruvyl transferase family protein, partial [Providencia stuartii]